MKGLLSLVLVTAILFGAGTAAAQTQPKPPSADATREQRLAQRKQERSVSLDEREKQRLTQRCTRAQQTVRELQQKTSRLTDNREETYEKIHAKLLVVNGRLSLANVDTLELEQQRLEFSRKTDAFLSVMRDYSQTLEDIAAIDCQADVTGFKALVDTARMYHRDLRSRSADIRNFVTDNIRPTLSGYVDELRPQPREAE